MHYAFPEFKLLLLIDFNVYTLSCCFLLTTIAKNCKHLWMIFYAIVKLLAICLFYHPYRTIFTKADRHTYVDNDYSYNDEELMNIHDHKNKYNTYLQESRAKRLAKSKAKYVSFLS